MNKFIAEYDRAMTDERGNLTLSFAVKGEEKKKAIECVQDMQKLKQDGKERLVVTVEEWREKRSKKANDYCWELIGKLSKATGEHKNDIYRKFIYELGVYREWKADEAAVETLMKVWQAMGIGWIVERVDGENGLVRVHGYYGSSSFNTKQMYQFIQNIVNECKEWGIETRTPDELAELAALHKAEKL